MAFDHQMQRSRYELKYVIDEPTARAVRDFARSYLQRDEHSIPSLGYAYPIYSIYLDGNGLPLYNATFQGQKNRYKLRIRYYDHNPWSPVFFEIKRRLNDVILKDRAVVRRDSMKPLLAGRPPMQSDLVNESDLDGYWALRRFVELRNNIHAEGRVIVYYQREAWVTPSDDNVRLTFDRKLAGARWDGNMEGTKWFSPPVQGTVLELKFDNRYPKWMHSLVATCNLTRASMAKYCQCTYYMPKQAPHPCFL
jgi:SPX domain protein involved in polyphosphate accumulation